jgi:hypothetical protein
MNLHGVRQHFAHHPMHFAVCALAAVLVVAAATFGLPILGAMGGLLCVAMMVGMVWMMVRHGH